MQFLQGAYSRRGISLERHFYPEPLIVTDLDLLSFDITARLTLTKTIGEAKSGTGKNAPKPLDRAIWMAGLMQLVQADSGIVITAQRPSTRVRHTARSLRVTAMSMNDLDRWEAANLPEDLKDVGAHGRLAFEADLHARKAVKGEPKLERTYWFLRSEVWFLDSWQAAKRVLGALEELHLHWTPQINDDQTSALRWLYAEALSILTLHIVVLVGLYRVSDGREWAAVVKDRLAEGEIPTHNQRALADAFDTYLAHVASELKAPPAMQVEIMGAFQPTPPDWADGLIDLIARLETATGIADFPRNTDLVVSERLVRRRHEAAGSLRAISAHDPEEFARMRRQVAAFLRGAVTLPDAIDRALIT
ncbi:MULTISPECIES: hypothetical protein [unclassified Rhodococcus (in: high G+C Gram-positive bacteria)]|uniref:hypothetical protein n=1 Tax=unclassified Rhodococcus (in: high G+C Gram-positive bacteria) TaxID=192944 RepID=UPI00117B82A1|nr:MULTISPECIES: hypothetical protein [unclassified Rhodococcus (in: high G+C Gram-positive bacteria)]